MLERDGDHVLQLWLQVPATVEGIKAAKSLLEEGATVCRFGLLWEENPKKTNIENYRKPIENSRKPEENLNITVAWKGLGHAELSQVSESA